MVLIKDISHNNTLQMLKIMDKKLYFDLQISFDHKTANVTIVQVVPPTFFWIAIN